MLFLFIAGSLFADDKQKIYLPWENGKLQVSDNGRYLQHENGTPFFWMGETGWLLPEKLNRDEASYYLSHCREAGFNVVQVQTVNGVPAINDYGQFSFPDGFNFKNINKKGVYGYWDHMDYIIKTAEKNGIYIGMVCIWGNLVKAGLMNEEEAKAYGTFLAERYKDSPNIIWFIGGDVRGDIKPEVWNTLARTIKSIDKNHLMTFHPFGRTSSIYWFHDAEWLDFNMFQSGHRRYDQTRATATTPPRQPWPKTTGAMWKQPWPRLLPNPSSTANPATRKFRKDCTTPASHGGKLPTCAVTLTGRYSPARSATPTATTPSCRC